MKEVASVAAAPIAQKPSGYWAVPVARAVVALVAAGVVTFTANHSATFGLVVFGAYAILEGLLVGILSLRTVADRTVRRLFVAQGVIGLIAGVLALALSSSGLGLFLYLVSVWAALTGFLELYCGLRSRSKDAAARDWIIVGAFTAVLAIVFLLIPSDSVLAVGLFGAYAVIVGVYLAIGGFSLKWAGQHPAANEHPMESGS